MAKKRTSKTATKPNAAQAKTPAQTIGLSHDMEMFSTLPA
jgi:hypothetical protein